MAKGLPLIEYMALPAYRDLFVAAVGPHLTDAQRELRVTCYGSVQLAPVGYSWADGLTVEVRSFLHGADSEPDRDFTWFNVTIPRDEVPDEMIAWAIRRRAELDKYEANWRAELSNFAAGRLMTRAVKAAG